MITTRRFRTATLTNTPVVVATAQALVGFAHFHGGAAAEIVILRGVDIVLASDAISVIAADQSFNSAGGLFSPKIRPGDTIISSGFVTGANNSTFTVVSATASKIVVSGGALEDEAVGASATLTARPAEYLRVPLAIGEKFAPRFDHLFERGLVVVTDSAAGDVGVQIFYKPGGDAL